MQAVHRPNTDLMALCQNRQILHLVQDLLWQQCQPDPQDFKAMLRISMLLEAGSPKQIKDAMELAMTSYQTLSHSTIPLQDKLNPVREQSQVEERDYVHTR